MSWRTLLTLVLLIAAAISGWSVWQQRPGRATPQSNSERADYLLHDFEIVVLDKQGNESFTLRAPTLARRPGDRTMALETPRFVIPPRAGSSESPWHVQARDGWVSASGEEVRLRGDVVATTTGRDDTPLRLATERLNVFPEAQRARAPTPVTITQPGSILRGQTLEAQLDRKRFQLTHVKVRYVPSGR
jgi:lipopolysaccharide export system protein LptC